MTARCIRCSRPSNVAASSLLPVLCASCARGDVLPDPSTPKVRRSRWWHRLLGR